MEEQGYYEAMRPEEYPPDPWWLHLIKVAIGFGGLLALMFIFAVSASR